MIWMLRNDSCRQDHLMYTNNMPQASGCVGQVNSIWRHSSAIRRFDHMPCSIIIIIISPLLLVLVPWHRHVVFLCFPHHRLSLVALQVWKVKLSRSFILSIDRKPIWWKSPGFTKLLLFSGGSSSPFCPYQGATTFYNLIFNWKPFAKNSTEPNYISHLIPP